MRASEEKEIRCIRSRCIASMRSASRIEADRSLRADDPSSQDSSVQRSSSVLNCLQGEEMEGEGGGDEHQIVRLLVGDRMLRRRRLRRLTLAHILRERAA